MIPYNKTMALKEDASYDHITTNDTVRRIVNHPAFKGFSPRNLFLNTLQLAKNENELKGTSLCSRCLRNTMLDIGESFAIMSFTIAVYP